MKVIFTRQDKRRLFLAAVGVIIGWLLMYSVEVSHHNNPPPDADIGGGMVILLGLAIGAINGAILFGSLVHPVIRARLKSVWSARALTVLIVTVAASAVWYLWAGADLMQKSDYNKELQSRYGSFIAYQEPVDFNQASGRHSDALTTDNDTLATSVTIDLHGCSPGTAKVNDAAGTTYFAFSGVRQSESVGAGFSDCVFYIGRAAKGQAWDSKLNAKCTWYISNTLSENQFQYPVTAQGVQFGGLLGSCQDLRTGVVPVDLNR